MTSPNARTVEILEKEMGWMAGIVEKHVPFPKPFGKKHDLFGIFDIVALDEDGHCYGVQATTVGNMMSRVQKIRASENSVRWLEHGGRILVVGWAKYGPRGQQKLWAHREQEITLGDFQ